MELIKILIDAFKEIGAGGTALLLIFSFIGWVAIKLVPPAIERTASAFERIAESMDKLELLLHSHANDADGTRKDVQKLHDRLDTAVSKLATKEDITAIVGVVKTEGELIRSAVSEHTKASQHQAERLMDKVDAVGK